MFRKILVANRGEIAIRAFRAAYELGARTVAVFPFEDRGSLHRQKADESYVIGEPGHPVRAYLDVDEIIRVALACGADAIYPGYGFLSENPELAARAAENGITFIGPPSRALEMAGNKVTAKHHAIAAGVPVLRSTEASEDVDELVAQAADIGFPIFVKAVAGGGGRGMRRVEEPAGAAARDRRGDARGRAPRSATRACSWSRPSCARATSRCRSSPTRPATPCTCSSATAPCSAATRRSSRSRRRRTSPTNCARRLHRDAVAFAESIGYVNAGTVEFLVDTAGERAGEHVFIEMNPRIQVEHTVTEEVTDVDLVQSQMRIAAGETLADLGLNQENIVLRGAALQCRITTEDPAQGFRPDTGRITTYRSPGGAGIRLDGGTTAAGSQISPHFDSMLAKLTCRARDFPSAVARAKRALAEFRIRGVATNIPFLRAVLDDPAFVAGDLSTAFIEERPQLLNEPPVARPRHQAAQLARRRDRQPPVRREARSRSRPAASCRRSTSRPPPPAGTLERLRDARPGRVRAGAARAGAARGDRDDLPRRPPVAARDPGAHARPRRGSDRTWRG